MTQIEMNGLSVAEERERGEVCVDEDDFDETIKAVKYHEHEESVKVFLEYKKRR